MSSIILHICASNIVKEELNLSDNFLAGSVLPDLKKMIGIDRNITHYLKYTIDENGEVMHLPDLDSFIKDNTFNLSDEKVLGCYAHLIEDKIWFEKFVRKYIKLNDKDLDIVTDVKTNEKYKFEVFSKRMYSDYYNIEKKVISKYHLNLNNLAKKIVSKLNDNVLVNCFETSLNNNEKYKISNKTFYITNEDVEEYISTSKKEVIKRIEELR